MGAVVGGLGFVVPAVVAVLALSLLFFGHSPPEWVRGAGAGSGAAVAAVAGGGGALLLAPSYERVRTHGARRVRWLVYLAAAGLGAALIGPYLVLVLLGCGLLELVLQERPAGVPGLHGWRSRRWRRGRSRRAGSARCAGRRSRSARSPTAGAS